MNEANELILKVCRDYFFESKCNLNYLLPQNMPEDILELMGREIVMLQNGHAENAGMALVFFTTMLITKGKTVVTFSDSKLMKFVNIYCIRITMERLRRKKLLEINKLPSIKNIFYEVNQTGIRCTQEAVKLFTIEK
jgi:hypothetical protein